LHTALPYTQACPAAPPPPVKGGPPHLSRTHTHFCPPATHRRRTTAALLPHATAFLSMLRQKHARAPLPHTHHHACYHPHIPATFHTHHHLPSTPRGGRLRVVGQRSDLRRTTSSADTNCALPPALSLPPLHSSTSCPPLARTLFSGRAGRQQRTPAASQAVTAVSAGMKGVYPSASASGQEGGREAPAVPATPASAYAHCCTARTCALICTPHIRTCGGITLYTLHNAAIQNEHWQKN